MQWLDQVSFFQCMDKNDELLVNKKINNKPIKYINNTHYTYSTQLATPTVQKETNYLA